MRYPVVNQSVISKLKRGLLTEICRYRITNVVSISEWANKLAVDTLGWCLNLGHYPSKCWYRYFGSFDRYWGHLVLEKVGYGPPLTPPPPRGTDPLPSPVQSQLLDTVLTTCRPSMCSEWSLPLAYEVWLSRFANCVHLSAIWENTALVQWIRCEPSGERLFVGHVLFYLQIILFYSAVSNFTM